MTIASARPSQGVEIAWPRPVEFRLFNGLIQYRARGSLAWITLFSLSDIGTVDDQIVLASLQNHGFTIDGNGKLHLTAVEAALAAEVVTRGMSDAGLGGRIDAEILARGMSDAGLGGRIDTTQAEISSARLGAASLADRINLDKQAGETALAHADDAKAFATAVNTKVDLAGALASVGVGKRLRPLTMRARISQSPGSVGAAYQGIGAALVPDHAIPQNGYEFRFYATMPSSRQFRLGIYRAPVAKADLDGFDPQTDPSSIQVFPTTMFSADAITDFVQNTAIPFRFAPSLLPTGAPSLPQLDTGYAYFFLIDGAGTNFSWAVGPVPPAGATARDRGLYRANNNWSAVSPSSVVAWDFLESEVAPTARLDPPRFYSLEMDRLPPETYPSLSIPLPRVVLRRPGQELVIPAQTVTLDPPGTQTVSNLVTKLITSAYPLPHRSVSGLVLSYNGTTLTPGTDYTLDAQEGRTTILGTAIANGSLGLASYTAPAERYDLICIDNQTREYSVLKGVERGVDCTEYQPRAGSGFTPAFMVHVTNGAGLYANATAAIVPVGLFHNQLRINRIAQDDDWLNESREHLAPLLGMMARGQPITLVGYGDSIVSTGSVSSGNWYVPNTAQRDDPTFFDAGRNPPDTLAAQPSFEGADGISHSRVGPIWVIKDAIEETSGSLVTYLNMGIGGTWSANGLTTGGVPNGLYPPRIAAATSLGAHLAIIHFGTNELGSFSTKDDMYNMIQAFLQAGSRVLVLGAPLQYSYRSASTLDEWIFTNRSLVEAARRTGVAYVPELVLCNPDNGFAGLGIARRTTAAVNSNNHPSFSQQARRGRFAAKIFRR